MKKIWILLLLCGMNNISFGQVVNNYSLTVNNDDPLNITVENTDVLLNFQGTDVLTITFKDLKTDISKKSVEIIPGSKRKAIPIATFDKTTINDDHSYMLNIPFSKLNHDRLKHGINTVYSIVVRDDEQQQTLLKFTVK